MGKGKWLYLSPKDEDGSASVCMDHGKGFVLAWMSEHEIEDDYYWRFIPDSEIEKLYSLMKARQEKEN